MFTLSPAESKVRAASRWPLVRSEAAVVLFFLAVAVVHTRPLAADLRGRMPAGSDPVIHLYTVSWLSGHLLPPRGLYGGNIFHPDPNGVMFSDLAFGTAVLLVPFRLFTKDPVLLCNLGYLLALAFSGWAFHRLVMSLEGRRSAALVAGVLATFGSHQMSHVYHLPLLTTGWLALFVLGLVRIVDRPTPGSALLCGTAYALTLQSTGYYGVAAALVGFACLALHPRRFLDRRRAAAAGLAILTAGLLSAGYLHAFTSLRAREGQVFARDPGLSAEMAFSPARDLGSRAYVYRGLLGTRGEQLFPGLLTLGLAGVALVRRRPHAWFVGGAAVLLVAISLGPAARLLGRTVPLPYSWLFAVPPFDSMRHPYTFAAVAVLLLAVLAGQGAAALAASRPAWLGVVAVGASLVETLGPGMATRPVAHGVPPVYEALRALPPGAALDLPVLEPETVLWAARHGQPVANGFGAFVPLYTITLHRYVRNHWLRRTPEDLDASKPTPFLLRHFDVRYVILPLGRRRGLEGLAAAFDRSQSFALVAEAEDGDRIYEVRRRP
jgi:hypothetical protein